MKTILTLLLSALTLSVYAGPSDSADFGMRAAREYAAKSTGTTAVARHDYTETKWVPYLNSKGGVEMRQERVPATTNIALVKSSKDKCEKCDHKR